ncbi:hypothetical protein [Flavobacterium lindanitolerans]|uniref:hypothetical protein n=2 Tax=Flavobacterium TaxID=237 RepID=UPI0027B8A377|nr:hypothetical protein [Flavobacterium lindanitolerans]
MRKLFFILIGGLVSISLSCEQDSTNNQENSVNFKKLREDDNYLKFKNDNRIIEFGNKIEDFIVKYKELRVDDRPVALANSLVKDFGKDNTLLYLDQIIIEYPEASIVIPNGTHDGDKCTRNLDGTTYWDKCTRWEAVKAYIKSAIGCSGLPTEATYNCVQRVICETC